MLHNRMSKVAAARSKQEEGGAAAIAREESRELLIFMTIGTMQNLGSTLVACGDTQTAHMEEAVAAARQVLGPAPSGDAGRNESGMRN